MKTIIWVMAIVLLSLNTNARALQDTGYSNNCYQGEPGRYSDRATLYHHRYALWYLPVLSNTVVNGVGVGFFAAPMRKQDSLMINGISVEADPLPLLAVPFFAVELAIRVPAGLLQKSRSSQDSGSTGNRILQKKRDSVARSANDLSEKNMPEKVKINGLSLSVGITERPTKMNGVAINAVWGMQKDMNGVEISGVLNWHYHFNGVVAGLFNWVKTGKGLQIGLYNKCNQGRVVQIGLLNKIGKHTRPIINFNLKPTKITS